MCTFPWFILSSLLLTHYEQFKVNHFDESQICKHGLSTDLYALHVNEAQCEAERSLTFLLSYIHLFIYTIPGCLRQRGQGENRLRMKRMQRTKSSIAMSETIET